MFLIIKKPISQIMNHMKNIYIIKSQKYFINEKMQSSYIQCILEEIFKPTLQEIMIHLIKKLNQKLVILTFGWFDHLVILDKSIWTCSTWPLIFLTNHKMVFLTSLIVQKFGQPKKINSKNNSICKYKNVNINK